MDGYRKIRAVKNQKEANKLHMFFSPTRVPKGLSGTEVRICLFLYDLQRKMKPPKPANFPYTREISVLPEGLRKQRMTRSSFKEGVRSFLENMPTSNTA